MTTKVANWKRKILSGVKLDSKILGFGEFGGSLKLWIWTMMGT